VPPEASPRPKFGCPSPRRVVGRDAHRPFPRWIERSCRQSNLGTRTYQMNLLGEGPQAGPSNARGTFWRGAAPSSRGFSGENAEVRSRSCRSDITVGARVPRLDRRLAVRRGLSVRPVTGVEVIFS
jgi:hypothetical protein